MKVLVAALLAAMMMPAFPQDEDPLGDINVQSKVKQAIKKGVSWLQQGRHVKGHQFCTSGDRLILLTYIHARGDEKHPNFQALLKKALEDPLTSTYDTVLIAMCLEELDRVKYQWRIHQCAQFLVDNMGPNGQIHYGKPTPHLPPAPDSNVATDSGRDPSQPRTPFNKPKVKKTIPVTKKRMGPTDYDHSNMQYLALGLRACHDAGIRFNPALISKFKQWWMTHQIIDPKTGAMPLQLDKKSSSGRTTVASIRIQPAGWDYDGGKINAGPKPGAKGTMTVGAVGALCIADYILGKDWKRSKNVLAGMQWLNVNFSVTEAPNDHRGNAWYYYYMYGLERAGMLYGTETIGKHRWYLEGAKKLLEFQAGDGHWAHQGPKKKLECPARDTCFAILFLKRATHRLDVATSSR